VRTGDFLIGLHNQQVWNDHRLSPTAKQSLAIIEGAGELLEPSVIAERCIITTGSMTSMLDTLERRCLVRRTPHPADRRKILVSITEEGAAIVEGMLPSLHARERTIMAEALSKTEQRQLREMLAKIQDTARAHADDEPDRTARRVKARRPTAAVG
jgi:DNA-binding MarR family transcriptional regulator